LLWRIGLPEHNDAVENRERLARRAVGVTFLILALYIAIQAIYTVTAGVEPGVSGIGIVLSVISLALMPGLGLAKLTNARKLGSRALLAESKETLICSYLSLTLFIGLGANAAFGWWWADIAAALAMVPWILWEGVEGIWGE
jgi:divalent metal cation (Fe/Co/Zn/Cd) transporter